MRFPLESKISQHSFQIRITIFGFQFPLAVAMSAMVEISHTKPLL